MGLTQVRKDLLIDFGEIARAKYYERDYPVDERSKTLIHIVYKNGFQDDIDSSLEEGIVLWNMIKRETMG